MVSVDELSQIFTDRVRELRRTRGWSRSELATRCGIHETQLYRYESGDHLPHLRHLIRLADELEVPIDYLVTEDGALVAEPGTEGVPRPPREALDPALVEACRVLATLPPAKRDLVTSLIQTVVSLHRVETLVQGTLP